MNRDEQARRYREARKRDRELREEIKRDQFLKEWLAEIDRYQREFGKRRQPFRIWSKSQNPPGFVLRVHGLMQGKISLSFIGILLKMMLSNRFGST